MKSKIIILLLIPFFLTGCYDYKEINDLAIVSAIGLAKEDDDNYKVILQVVNTQNHEGESSSQSDFPNFFTYTAVDKSIFKALKKITTIGSKKMYFNQFLLLLIDENVVKDDISTFFDVFLRETESRKEYNIFISKNNESEEILRTMTSLETLNAKNIITSNELNSDSIGTTVSKKFEEVLKDFLNKNKEIIIPTLILENNKSEYDNTDILKNSYDEVLIKNGPTAIFKNSKLNTYIGENETMCLKILTNDTDNIVYTYEKGDEIISLELLDIKNKLKFDKNENKVIVNIEIESILSEVSANINLKKLSTIKKYNKILSKAIEHDLYNFIDNTKFKYNSDLIGIKELIYKYENKYYKEIIDDYDNFYKNLNFDINVDFKIIEKGNTTKEINNE